MELNIDHHVLKSEDHCAGLTRELQRTPVSLSVHAAAFSCVWAAKIFSTEDTIERSRNASLEH